MRIESAAARQGIEPADLWHDRAGVAKHTATLAAVVPCEPTRVSGGMEEPNPKAEWTLADAKHPQQHTGRGGHSP